MIEHVKHVENCCSELPSSETHSLGMSQQHAAANLLAVAAEATPSPAPEVERNMEQMATASCVDIESSMDAPAAPDKTAGKVHSADDYRAMFETVLQLSTPFLNIRDALTLRATFTWMQSTVNTMPWHDLETAMPIRLTVAGLRGSVGLRGSSGVS